MNTLGEHNTGNGHYIVANSLNGWSNAVATLGESETELGFSGNPAVDGFLQKVVRLVERIKHFTKDASREQSDMVMQILRVLVEVTLVDLDIKLLVDMVT